MQELLLHLVEHLRSVYRHVDDLQSQIDELRVYQDGFDRHIEMRINRAILMMQRSTLDVPANHGHEGITESE